jgi:hypothetical protein
MLFLHIVSFQIQLSSFHEKNEFLLVVPEKVKSVPPPFNPTVKPINGLHQIFCHKKFGQSGHYRLLKTASY